MGIEHKPATLLNKLMKVVVFDLDRTLGYFHCLVNIPKVPQPANKLYQLARDLSNIPECPILRPGIIEILRYVYAARIMKDISHIILYSNNPNSNLVHVAITMMELQLGYDDGPMFDHIIDANTVARQTYDTYKVSPNDSGKTLETLIHYIPSLRAADVIFIDDCSTHPIQSHKPNGLQYITPTPYSYNMNAYQKDTISSVLCQYGYTIYIRTKNPPEVSYIDDHMSLFSHIINAISV